MKRLLSALQWLSVGATGKWFVRICVALGLFIVLIVVFIPFSPLRPERAEFAESEVCGGGAVALLLTREWDQPTWWRRIGPVEVTSQWRNTDTGQLYPPVGPIEVPAKTTPPTGTITSDLVRVAPEDEGNLTQDLTYVVRGSILFIPRNETVEITTMSALRVRECQ